MLRADLFVRLRNGGRLASLSGPASSYAPIPTGMKAYFSYINKRKKDGKRGVYGRQIVWKYYDDGYNPANTVQLTRKLVEEDKVFATVGQLGTEHNLAVRPYMNQRKVPQSLVSTGASNWGTQGKEYPWTIGWQPDYIAEGRIYGKALQAAGSAPAAIIRSAIRVHSRSIATTSSEKLRLEPATLMFYDLDTRELLRTRANPLTPEQIKKLRGLRQAGPPPRPAR